MKQTKQRMTILWWQQPHYRFVVPNREVDSIIKTADADAADDNVTAVDNINRKKLMTTTKLINNKKKKNQNNDAIKENGSGDKNI